MVGGIFDVRINNYKNVGFYLYLWNYSNYIDFIYSKIITISQSFTQIDFSFPTFFQVECEITMASVSNKSTSYYDYLFVELAGKCVTYYITLIIMSGEFTFILTDYLIA